MTQVKISKIFCSDKEKEGGGRDKRKGQGIGEKKRVKDGEMRKKILVRRSKGDILEAESHFLNSSKIMKFC